jgi:hypothetical protein
MLQAGVDMSKEEVAQLVKLLDVDGDGRITQKEISSVLGSMSGKTPTMATPLATAAEASAHDSVSYASGQSYEHFDQDPSEDEDEIEADGVVEFDRQDVLIHESASSSMRRSSMVSEAPRAPRRGSWLRTPSDMPASGESGNDFQKTKIELELRHLFNQVSYAMKCDAPEGSRLR